MGKRIIRNMVDVLVHYKVHLLGFLALVLYVMHMAGRMLFKNTIYHPSLQGNVTDNGDIYIICMDVLLVLVFGSVVVMVVLSVIYSDRTDGRSLIKDQWMYKLTPMELLIRFNDSDPYRIQEQDLRKINWKQADGIILGYCGKGLLYHSTYSNRGEGKVALAIGAPGSGKTSCVVCCSAMKWKGSVFAIDIKSDIYNAVKRNTDRRIVRFIPDDPEESVHFDPLADMRAKNQDEQIDFLEKTAMVIIPDDMSTDGKYFVETARTLFIGITLQLLSENVNLSLPEIAKEILKGNGVDWITKIHDGKIDAAKYYTNSLYGSNEKNVNGAYGELAKAVRPYATGALAEILTDDGHCISVQTMEDGRDIYVEIRQDKIKQLAPVTTLLTQCLMMSALTSRPDVSSGQTAMPILFILDEIAQLTFPFDTLSAMVSTGRSKYCSCLIASQSTSQIIRKYSKEACIELIDDCAYVCVYSALSPESQKFWSDYFGTSKSLNISTSESGKADIFSNSGGSAGTGTQETRIPVIRPEQFANLAKDNKVAVKANGRYVIAQKIKWYA